MKVAIVILLCVASLTSTPTYDYSAYRKSPQTHSYSVFNKDISDPHFLRRVLMPAMGKSYYPYMSSYYSGKSDAIPYAASAKEQTTTVVETAGGAVGKKTATTMTSTNSIGGKSFVSGLPGVPISVKNSEHPYTIYNVRNTVPSKGKHIAYPIYEQKPITIVNVKNKHPAPLPPKIPQQPITIMNIKNHHQAPVIPADPQNIHIMNIDKELPAPPAPPQLPAQVSIMNVDENREEDVYLPVAMPSTIVSEDHVITDTTTTTKGKGTSDHVVVQETVEPYEEVYSRTGRSAPTGYVPIPMDFEFAKEEFSGEPATADGDAWETVTVPVVATTELPEMDTTELVVVDTPEAVDA